MKCQFCETPLADDANFCLKCGRHQKSGLKIRDKTTSGRDVAIAVAAAGGGLVLAVLVVVLISHFDNRPNENQTSSQQSQADTPIFFPGDLAASRSGPLLLALSEQASERLSQLANANDKIGVRQLIVSGEVVVLPQGTRFRVIQTKGVFDVTCEIRVVDGEYLGQSGWVPAQALVKMDSARGAP